MSSSPSSPSGEGTVVSLPPRDRASSQEVVTPAPVASTPAPVVAPTPSEPQPDPEEDLLRDILDELDKERSKRAQAEADFRHIVEEKQALERQLAQQKHAPPKEEEIVSRQAFVAMEAQVKGFKQLVDALTLGKPAIAAAAKQSSPPSRRALSSSSSSSSRPWTTTLPLHVVRLLEVLPWDPRAQEHIFGREVIYEWQVYDDTRDKKKWHSQLRQFPARLKNLPITKPKHETQEESNNDRSLLHFLAGSGEKAALLQNPSKHGVLTDIKVTQILKIEAGYPLPQDGGRWEWVGGWRVDKRIKESNHPATGEKQTVDCDDDGWSYGNQVQDFEILPTELIWENPGENMERKVRRRRWSRQRVLVDYPFASERTKQYLKLLAENARLTITATKISDQLVATKTKLTETEETLMQLKEERNAEAAKYTEELKQQEELFKEIGVQANSSQPTKRLQEFLQKNDQVKEIGSKISQWVARKSSEDMTSTDSIPEDTVNDASALSKSGDTSTGGSSHGSGESGNNPFNWRKVGRGGLIEKLAGKKHPGRPAYVNVDTETLLLEEAEEAEEESSRKEESSN